MKVNLQSNLDQFKSWVVQNQSKPITTANMYAQFLTRCSKIYGIIINERTVRTETDVNIIIEFLNSKVKKNPKTKKHGLKRYEITGKLTMALKAYALFASSTSLNPSTSNKIKNASEVQKSPNHTLHQKPPVIDAPQTIDVIFSNNAPNIYTEKEILNLNHNIVLDDIANQLTEQNHVKLSMLFPTMVSAKELPIMMSHFSTRTRNYLIHKKIQTWGDLIIFTPFEILKSKNVGKKSLHELLKKLVEVAILQAKSNADSSEKLSNNYEKSITNPIFQQSLAHFASWAVTETDNEKIGDLFELKITRQLPSDVEKAFKKVCAIKLLEFHTNVTAPAQSSLSEEIELCLSLLNERTQQILLDRISFRAPPTLDNIGCKFNLTRERIRQIEVNATDTISAAIKDGRFPLLNWRANTARTLIGLGLPIKHSICKQAFERILHGISGNIQKETALNFLLWLAGPYKYSTTLGWLCRDSLPNRKLIETFTDERSLLDLNALQEELDKIGLIPQIHETWYNQFGPIRFVENKPTVWPNSVTDKAALLLHCWHRPATPSELNHAINEGYSQHSFRNRIFEDQRFMRIDKERIGLREWGLEEYSGIAVEIEQEITRSGGALYIDEIVNRLVSQFSANENSIRMLLMAPMFIIDNGKVRLRNSNEPFKLSSTLSEVYGCFLSANHILNLRISITPQTLRGSGMSIHPAVASWLGVLPGKKRHYECEDQTVSITWPTSSVTPSIGSIRNLVLSRKCKKGDRAMLCFDRGTESLEIRRISKDALIGASRSKILALLTGLPITGNKHKDHILLRKSLGLKTSSESIKHVLRKREEFDLDELISENISEDIDQAIESLGNLL